MTEARELIIIGTGGNAYDILDVVEACNVAGSNRWKVIGFLDDSKPAGSIHCDVSVLGRVRDAVQFRSVNRLFINAIGSDRTFAQREEIITSTGLRREDFATLVHPSATVSNRATLGFGAYVCAHACIAGAVTIGDHVIICPGAIIGHDATIGDFSILAPGCCISGAVDVGQSCYIGARAVVRPRVRLTDGTLVGMGAVVVHSPTDAAILVGNPARPMKRTIPASN